MVVKYSERGFIAVVSTIVIGMIILMLVVSVGLSAFFNRYDALDRENKTTSEFLAQSCVRHALLSIARDPQYVPHEGGECVGVSGACGASPLTCKICSVVALGSVREISARARYGTPAAYTNVRVTAEVTQGDVVIQTWEEIATYDGDTCVLD